jgi:hypothetical protein
MHALRIGLRSLLRRVGHAHPTGVHDDFPDWTEGFGYRAQGYRDAMMDSDERMILRVMLVRQHVRLADGAAARPRGRHHAGLLCRARLCFPTRP